MSENDRIELTIGQTIHSPTVQYEVQKCLGSGTYGVVVQCRNQGTGETVALKITKNQRDNELALQEDAVLRKLGELRSDGFNIVRLNRSFVYNGHVCLEFQLLDMDLMKFMTKNPGQHLQLKQIRPILLQLATSLDFLKRTGIVHGDLKTENIMMVDHIKQPLRVRIIDFGLACNNPQQQTGQTFQTLCYRCPEILAKRPFTEAIDVWSLGCIAAELFMGQPLFAAISKTDLMMEITLRVGNQYIFWPQQWMESRFLLTRSEVFEVDDDVEYCDLMWFIDVLKKMLKVEPLERITPRGILEHPFITMAHLQGAFKNRLYVKWSRNLMNIVQDPRCEDGGVGPQTVSVNTSEQAPPPQRRRKRDPASTTLQRKRRGEGKISKSKQSTKDKATVISDSGDLLTDNGRLRKKKRDGEEVSEQDRKRVRKRAAQPACLKQS